MAETLLVLQIVLFGLALGLGIYLLMRARGDTPVLLPGLTLLSFALFVGSDALANYLDSPDTRFFLSLLSTVLLVLTLLLAVGALVALQRREMLPAWRYATYAAIVLVAGGAAGLLLSADIGVRIAAVLAAGAGVLLLGLAARSEAPALRAKKPLPQHPSPGRRLTAYLSPWPRSARSRATRKKYAILLEIPPSPCLPW